MNELDTARAPRGILGAQRLILEVSEIGDMAERHYLELKSTLDLGSKRDKEKIAKFVLGAANRMPDVAATAFEGYGVMIVGVSRGAIIGIPPVEMMEIAKIVQQYVGAAGPRWDVLWVPLEGTTNQVLIVLVDPPLPGQRPFPCRTSGDSLAGGRIYVRAEGETREANADEMDQLIGRGFAPLKAKVDFAVEVLGDISSCFYSDESTVEEYLTAKRKGLLAALPSEELPRSSSLKESGSSLSGFAAAYAAARESTSAIINSLTVPEDRTEDEYRSAIVQWEARFRVSWAKAKVNIIASQLAPVFVRLTNRTTTFFHDVELKLHLEGDVSALEYVDAEWINDFSGLELPPPPRKWGPRQPRMAVTDYSRFQSVAPAVRNSYVPPSVSFKNGGSVSFDLNVGDLRPLGVYESEDQELVLLVADAKLLTVHGEWQLTARGHDEVYAGEMNIPVAGVKDVTVFARRVLGLADQKAQ
ncbi:hypothetical protein [Clavibacter sp. km1a]|uniref:hypothetical protein n=1 Tax=Clavibacter sp. km1a TaxID=3459136 RepID=UPI004041B1F3